MQFLPGNLTLQPRCPNSTMAPIGHGITYESSGTEVML